MFEAERKSMERKRKSDKVELTQTYAWHGAGTVRPDSIAAGDGFMMHAAAAGAGLCRERACMSVPGLLPHAPPSLSALRAPGLLAQG